MFSFLKRIFGIEEPPISHRSATSQDHELRELGQPTAAVQQGNSSDYFTTLRNMQEAISKRKYQQAAVFTRENMRQIPGLVRDTQLEYGRFDIQSIPSLDQGGIMLALVGDTEGLKEMQQIVRSAPELQPWISTVEQHEEDHRTLTALMTAIEHHPGCLQTDVRELIGATDGHRVAVLLSWLEKSGIISRTKKGRTHSLMLSSSAPEASPLAKKVVHSHRSDGNQRGQTP